MYQRLELPGENVPKTAFLGGMAVFGSKLPKIRITLTYHSLTISAHPTATRN